MKFFVSRRINHISVTLLVCVALAYALHIAQTAFENKQWFSGWLLVAMIIFLMVYNLRKKLSFLPLGGNAIWMQLHIYVGWTAFFLFLTHIGWRISNGVFGLVFTFTFAGVCVFGILGILISRLISRQLSQHGEQLLFERIPGFARVLQNEAEDIVRASAEQTMSTTLSDLYTSKLSRHFMSPPRSIWYWMRSNRQLFDLKNELSAQERFMNESERKSAQQLRELIDKRHDLDGQYALQALLKSWLYVHIPLSYSVVLMIIVHITLVYAFGVAS